MNLNDNRLIIKTLRSGDQKVFSLVYASYYKPLCLFCSRVHQAVIASHEKESGITIHYINERYDEGNTIFQATCPVLPTDTPDTLAIRVHQLEYEYFPRVIEATILGKNLSI